VSDNRSPEIQQINAVPSVLDVSGTANVSCTASDPDGDSLFYNWSADAGSFSGQGETVQWTPPDDVGYYYLKCLVLDSKGGSALDSIGISVGRLAGSYPFEGNASDTSGYENHGQVFEAASVTDRFGSENSALWFDGSNDYILVKNHPSLNFEDEISVLFWIRVDSMYNREAYPISHGNWQNRWKISITDQGIRWTVKTTTGIKDLDSDQKLDTGIYYHAACIYDGSRYEIYINGELDKSSTYSGKIMTTSLDLTIGQALPNESNYNFRGILDDILIYNKGLSSAEVKTHFDQSTGIGKDLDSHLPLENRLMQNYPNPFNPKTVISYQLSVNSNVDLSIYNMLGQMVMQLVSGVQPAGNYKIDWDASDFASGVYFYTLSINNAFTQSKKLLLLK